MGRDHYINTTISAVDLSTKTSLPFYVAADRPGSYLTATIGESAFANGQPDGDTVALWRLDEEDTTQSMPAYFDYDNFEAGPGSPDDWGLRNFVDPVITDETAYTGQYSLHMQSSWGRNFETGTGEPTTYPYDTNIYPFMCMAYKIPSGTINNMLIHVDGVGWRSITMTQTETPTSYPKVASWNPLITNNSWQHKCINLDAQLDVTLGTGVHNINAVIWHDGGGGPTITGEFWIDDFIISAQPHNPLKNNTIDSAGRIQNQHPSSPITATGGTVTYANGYTIHTFNSSGTFTVTSGVSNVTALIVAGGGGGGATGSGGGAGGALYSSVPVSPQAYTVTVGGGGAGGVAHSAWNGTAGGNSIFSTLTAIGGGGGVTHGGGVGGNGGSGGGGAITTGGAAPVGGAGTSGQGNTGGAGYVDASWIGNSGGGGGAHSVGIAGGNSAGTGNGGSGKPFSILGTTNWYGGGGGGGEVNGSFVGAGGIGGGGSGAINAAGTNGTANTGGGGGGGSYDGSYYNGGSGGSGVVIIRYPTTQFTSQTNTIGTTSIQGKVGKARLFNGSTDLITLGSNQIVDNLNNFTIDAWINPSTQAVNHYRVLSKQHVVYIGQYADQVSFYMGNGSAWQITDMAGGKLELNKWQHVSWVKSGTNYFIYINGRLAKSGTGAPATVGTNNNYTIIGSHGTTQYWNGGIDELRVSNTARTADEIRQAYEADIRSHQVTIDFAAKLDSTNLISASDDLSFAVDGTVYGLANKGSMLFAGDKIIVRENYEGVEYKAQGTVTSVILSTGATTVSSWDSGSTFPPIGYSVNADVFKWQTEHWNIIQPLSTHIDSASHLSVRISGGGEGRTIWLDGLSTSGDYLTNPLGSTITSSVGYKFFQYRSIFHSGDRAVSASINNVTLNYIDNSPPTIPVLNIDGNFNISGIEVQ